MSFCTNCGHRFDDTANFCPRCGTPTNQPPVQDQRKQTFAGDIQKCPNCGEPLSAFEVTCHACGYELRNVDVSSAVQRLANEIAKLEANRGKNNTTVITKDGKKRSKVIHEEEDTTDAQISNTIKNFPIPNTKEDVFEFMILASANINGNLAEAEYYGIEEVMQAWYVKFEQVYQKAKLTFGDNPDFEKIKVIYENKKKEIESDKKKFEISKTFSWVPLFGMVILAAVIMGTLKMLGLIGN